MITQGIHIPANYEQLYPRANVAATPHHWASYASAMYQAITWGDSRRARCTATWRTAQAYGAQVYRLLRDKPWGDTEICDSTQVGRSSNFTEWYRAGDFVAIQFDLVWVVIDMRFATVQARYYNGPRLHCCDPIDKVKHLDKARQIEEGTWPVPACGILQPAPVQVRYTWNPYTGERKAVRPAQPRTVAQV